MIKVITINPFTTVTICTCTRIGQYTLLGGTPIQFPVPQVLVESEDGAQAYAVGRMNLPTQKELHVAPAFVEEDCLLVLVPLRSGARRRAVSGRGSSTAPRRR